MKIWENFNLLMQLGSNMGTFNMPSEINTAPLVYIAATYKQNSHG